MSESAAQCWLNQFARSRIGELTIDDDTVSEFWEDGRVDFSTKSLQEHFPVLEHKIGADKKLMMNLHLRDIKLELGRDEEDILMHATLCWNVWYLDEPDAEEWSHALYDENPVIIAANAYLDQDFFYPALLDVKLDREAVSGKTQPTNSTIEFSESQYRSFQSSLGYSLVYMRSYINELFLKQGIEAPYYPYELYTMLKFYPGKAVVFLELKDRADEWFEDRFWDAAARAAAERDHDHGILPDFSFDDDRKHQREETTVEGKPDDSSPVDEEDDDSIQL
jgi:hypothetical protein